MLGLQLLNMLEVAAISAGTPFFPEGWQTATAWLVRLVGLAWGQREGVACLGFWDMGHRRHSPSLEFCPAECRSLPVWHWSELWAFACRSPQCPAQGQSGLCKRKELWQERTCVPPLAARVSQQEDAASAMLCAGCRAPAPAECPHTCLRAQPKAPSAAPAHTQGLVPLPGQCSFFTTTMTPKQRWSGDNSNDG